MRYSDEFKNHVVSRLLTGEVTILQAQERDATVSCQS